MPELPEVETIKRDLEKTILNRKIVQIEIKVSKIIDLPSHEFKKIVLGSKIKSIARRAKILIVHLSNHYSLLIHLKLTGQLIYRIGNCKISNTIKERGRENIVFPLEENSEPKASVRNRGFLTRYRDKNGNLRGGGHPVPSDLTRLPNQYTRVVFTFDDKSHLFFNDLRLFGYIRLLKTEKVDEILAGLKLGPEPLDKKFILSIFQELVNKKKGGKIKQVLMDQSFIAGIGNIYGAEICFYAKVHPTKLINKLTKEEIKKVYTAIKTILPKAISSRGSSVDTYVDAFGRQGGFVPYLTVYGRENQPCKVCQTLIKRVKIGGRSSYFCPSCQKS